ncbi:hypothetical protein BUALT_Bualt11G0026700 [Buddleja alternifolia]|uniref:Transposase n=1 Tax=Buddleja alternifolia TaxID=168488 RepID=A0AAV6WSC0_9LAMI|nr:hypothetical protein BUALT_Bualt11G0026700 [Buddleja alternifolia]
MSDASSGQPPPLVVIDECSLKKFKRVILGEEREACHGQVCKWEASLRTVFKCFFGTEQNWVTHEIIMDGLT